MLHLLKSPFNVRPAFLIFFTAFLLRIAHVCFLMPFLEFEFNFNDGQHFHQLAGALVRGIYDIKTPGLGLGLSPVYVGFIALIYSLTATDPLFVRLVQIILGAFSCVGLYQITNRLFGPRAGWIAGLLAAFCGIFIYFDSVLLKPSLTNALLIAFFWLLQRFRSCIGVALSALVIGLVCMMRMQVLIVLLPMTMLAWRVMRSESLTIRFRQTVLFLIGFFGAIALTLWGFEAGIHKTQGAPNASEFWIPQSGIHFYIGNFEGANGAYARVPGVRASSVGHVVDTRKIAEKELGRALSSEEVNRYWLRKTAESVFRHPAKWIQTEMKKFFLIWNDYEVPDSANYAYWRRFSPVLKLPLVTYGWLAPLALLGLLRLRNDPRTLVQTMQVFFIFYVVALLMTFVTSDYRLPLYPVFIIFSAFVIDRLPEDLKHASKNDLLRQGVLFAIFFVFCNYQTYLSPARYDRHAYQRHIKNDTLNRARIDQITGAKRDISRIQKPA